MRYNITSLNCAEFSAAWRKWNEVKDSINKNQGYNPNEVKIALVAILFPKYSKSIHKQFQNIKFRQRT